MIAAALLVLGMARADTVLNLGDRPTVVAFVGAEQQEIMYSADWARVLYAFKPELDAARPALEMLPVVVREVYSPTILFRSRGREWHLEPDPASLLSGYYLWSPEGPRYLCRGAMKKDALLSTVTAFLGQVRSGTDGELAGCEQARP